MRALWPVALGAIERFVGPLDQRVRIERLVPATAADAAADRDLDGTCLGVDRRGSDGCAEPFRDAHQGGLVTGRYEHQEFLAAAAAGRVVWPDTVDDVPRSFAKHGVASEMPVGIVDELEMIEVEQNHAERSALAQLPRTARTADHFNPFDVIERKIQDVPIGSTACENSSLRATCGVKPKCEPISGLQVSTQQLVAVVSGRHTPRFARAPFQAGSIGPVGDDVNGGLKARTRTTSRLLPGCDFPYGVPDHSSTIQR